MAIFIFFLIQNTPFDNVRDIVILCYKKVWIYQLQLVKKNSA